MSRAGLVSGAGVCAALLLAACGTRAADQSQPKPALALSGRVVDAANILDPALEQRLMNRLAAVERDTGAQLVVATTPSLNNQPIETYSINLARSWRLGSKERNDGVLLLVAPNDRKVRIEVGLGLERRLPDEFCAKVITETILPPIRAGDLQTGIESGVTALDAALRRPTSAHDETDRRKTAA